VLSDPVLAPAPVRDPVDDVAAPSLAEPVAEAAVDVLAAASPVASIAVTPPVARTAAPTTPAVSRWTRCRHGRPFVGEESDMVIGSPFLLIGVVDLDGRPAACGWSVCRRSGG
jgi:hypothetical protein